MAENHNFFNFTGWENILHSLPFNHKIIHYKYGPSSRITPSPPHTLPPLKKKKKKKRLKKFKFCETFLLFLRFTKIFSSVIISYLAQTGLPMATRSSRSSPLASHCFQTATSYVKGHAFGKTKRSEWPKRPLHRG